MYRKAAQNTQEAIASLVEQSALEQKKVQTLI
jgi:hypothetical protein